jgi:hypothetical protein
MPCILERLLAWLRMGEGVSTVRALVTAEASPLYGRAGFMPMQQWQRRQQLGEEEEEKEDEGGSTWHRDADGSKYSTSWARGQAGGFGQRLGSSGGSNPGVANPGMLSRQRRQQQQQQREGSSKNAPLASGASWARLGLSPSGSESDDLIDLVLQYDAADAVQ